jgi:hypothetical protein
VTREQDILSFQITTKAPEETEMDRVHRLLPTGSERFMVHKVDRLAMRLCAQQQCVDPLQLTLSNVGVVARSQFGNTCTATTNIM